jgi:hypothetical protein
VSEPEPMRESPLGFETESAGRESVRVVRAGSLSMPADDGGEQAVSRPSGGRERWQTDAN